jgi:hypothetical protein
MLNTTHKGNPFSEKGMLTMHPLPNGKSILVINQVTGSRMVMACMQAARLAAIRNGWR